MVIVRAVAWVGTVATNFPGQITSRSYLDAVCKEVVRLCPDIPFGVRRSTSSLEIGKWRLPGGSTIGLCIYLLHRDEASFPQPARFLPDRFLSMRPSRFEYLPFGGGQRGCVAGPLFVVSLLANRHFEPLARRAGLDFDEIAPASDYHSVVEKQDLWQPVSGTRHVIDSLVLRPMRRTFDVIRDRNIPGATVVAAPVSAFGARIAQERLGVPLVSVCIQPSVLRSCTQPSVLKPLPLSSRLPRLWNQSWLSLMDRVVVDRLVRAETDAFRRELNLHRVCKGFAAWSLSPSRVIGLFPDWYAQPQPDWPPQVRLTGFPLYDEGENVPLASEVSSFLDASEPPIIFTPGSAMRHARSFFEAAVTASERLKARAVLLTRYPDQVPSRLPAYIRWFDSAPFSRLFHRARLVVHHGGIGTASQAIGAGLPQIIMPMAFDQHDNARRLERLGVARSLDRRRFSGPAVARMIAALLDSQEVGDRCRRMAGRVRATASLTECCELIEEAKACRLS
jgi:rhamnosyltransferase subunit B